MARRMSGLRTTIKIAKAINKLSKDSARHAERRRKEIDRQQARSAKEHERALREQVRAAKEYERRSLAIKKRNAADEKLAFKEALNDAKLEYEFRCEERATLRKQYIDEVLK
ncbi:hypothetical protein [Psychromonas sp. SR45-3]|uniref:hypothetical protein n=1 Tax=Psychromonas sp. SR45-3 TaxID=2760930 RepID=UPI0015F990F4|nr:hypothetical protein [Psychromonas sp. SR45-3]MBB1271234.1 hypothetical protein [Psychromonas sp. SR45-3]